MTVKLSTRDMIQYSLLALPLSFAGLPLYIHMPDFYARNIGMDLAVIGLVLMAIRLFDAIQDPFIGYLGDKSAARRILIMTFGAILLCFGMLTLSWAPQFSIPPLLWFTISMVCATTGFSILSINLNMIGGFVDNDAQQRTRISSWREGLGLVGLVIAAMLPPLLQSSMNTALSMRIFALIFAATMVVSFALFFVFMRDRALQIESTSGPKKIGLSFLPILLGRNKSFFGICLLSQFASSIPAVMVLFFIQDYLGAATYTGLFLFLYFISGAAFMAIWVKLAAHYGKIESWALSIVLTALTFIWAFFLQDGDILAYGLICALSGIALGADLALPPAILADRISDQNKEHEATQHYAAFSFIPKFAMACASGFTFIMLGLNGFAPGEDSNSNTDLTVITLYALIPCALKIIAAILLWILIKKEGKNYAKNNERSSHHGAINIS